MRKLTRTLQRALARKRTEGSRRARLERERSRYEQRLQDAVRLTGLGIFEHDHESDTIYLSEQARVMLGYAPDEPVSLENTLAHVLPDDRKATEAAVARAQDPAGNGLFQFEHRVLSSTGALRWVLVRGQTIFEGEGPSRKPLLTWGAALDITENKLRELELDSERELFDLVSRGASVAEFLERMTEHQEQMFPGMLCSVLLSSPDHSELRFTAGLRLPEPMRDALDVLSIGPDTVPCGRTAHSVQPCIVRDLLTDPMWVKLRDLARALDVRACWSVPIISPAGHALGTFAAYSREPRSPSPEELRALERAARLASLAIERQRYFERLKESELRLRTAFDHAPIGISMSDPEGRLTYQNRAMQRLTGTTREQPSNQDWAQRVVPEDRNRVLALWRSVLEGQARTTDVMCRFSHGPGEVRTARLQAAAIRDQNNLVGVVGIAEDVTERTSLEEQLRQVHKMEAVGRLAGGVAHDFNNLLTVISNSVSLLEARRGVEDRGLLDLIHTATDRAAALTSQLLAFSRKQVMRPYPVDLNQLVTSHCALLSRMLGEQITLRTELSDRPAITEADPNFIEQVLMNLVANARDAMPQGGTITLRVESVLVDCPPGSRCTQAPFVRISVRDTGTGIHSGEMPHIFEPFYSTKEQGKGTGLGLATVHGIVQQHGGKVDIETEVGRGSTFHVYLPQVSTAPSTGRKPVNEAPHGSETILLVEDEQAVRQTVRAALEGCGYTVYEAPDGDAALEVWREHAGRFDLLLTDIVMPGSLSGIQLAERLRARRASLPIVYMSGYSGHDIAKDPKATLVPKPFQLPVLARVVREKLDAAPRRPRADAPKPLQSRS